MPIITLKNHEMWSDYINKVRDTLWALNKLSWSDQDKLSIKAHKDRLWQEVHAIDKQLSPFNEYWQSLVIGDHIKKGAYYKRHMSPSLPYHDNYEYVHMLDFDDEWVTVEEFIVTEDSFCRTQFMDVPSKYSAKNFVLELVDHHIVEIDKSEWDKQLELLNTLKRNFDEIKFASK